ncbi:hypothetical protein [Alkalibacterium kapii]|uniref:Uncharacterized protein n=1 Tax=Alkalibacterium kapii TaxID=426704 RepID=A0A511AUU0_9LACT|nr:hypothetical protein [Alkalibacterium kapii]GEK91113.1 hypothetical protein AKA01nite_07350 [Alkalibacterium kapii]
MKITVFAKDVPGVFTGYNIKINDSRFINVDLGEEKTVEIPAETAKIRVKKLGGRSNQLRVENGDYIKISLSEWYILKIMSYLLFTYVLIYFGLMGTGVYYTLNIILLVILFGYFDTFKLTKVKDPQLK